MTQHLENNKRSVMHDILLILNDTFNKFATLDIENKLIQYMDADEKFVLQNGNAGQSVLHNYYQRGFYEKCFQQLLSELIKRKLANKTIYEIKNREIFKYSPYKELTDDQFSYIESLLNLTADSLENGNEKKLIVQGGAGPGKTVLAICFIKYLVDILQGNSNFDNLEDVLSDDYSNL